MFLSYIQRQGIRKTDKREDNGKDVKKAGTNSNEIMREGEQMRIVSFVHVEIRDKRQTREERKKENNLKGGKKAGTNSSRRKEAKKIGKYDSSFFFVHIKKKNKRQRRESRT